MATWRAPVLARSISLAGADADADENDD